MIRRLFRRLFRLALVIGAAAAVYKVVQARRPSPDLPQGDAWPPTPRPDPKPAATATAPPAAREASAPEKASAVAATAAPPATSAPTKSAPAAKKAAATAKAPASKKAASNGAGWVHPVDGTCPTTHPVKGKLTSLIYHLPGMTAYARTLPDRCYRDEDAAQADGLRKAKR